MVVEKALSQGSSYWHYQTKKISEDLAESTKTGLITVQHIFFPDGTDIFKEDDARIHQTWNLLNNDASFSHMDWLPQSPDLSLFRMCWRRLWLSGTGPRKLY